MTNKVNIKTYLTQVKQLLEKLDNITGQNKIYNVLSELTARERSEIWELCNEINSLNIVSPFKILQKQIENIEGKDYKSLMNEDSMPTGVEIAKGEAHLISDTDALMFANYSIEQLLKNL